MKIHRNRLFAGLFLAVSAFLFLGLVATADALEPSDAGLWHEPGAGGSGVLLEYSVETDQFAVLWFDHGLAGGQIWMLSESNCPAGVSPCEVVMLSTSGTWLGGDDLMLHEMGTLTIERVPGGLETKWTLLGLSLPDGAPCGSMTPGGLILWECVGDRTLVRLTRPR